VLETFVALLTSEERKVRTRSHQSLQALTGQQIPYVPEGKPEERAASIAKWKQWVATSGASAKWTLPLADHAVPLGRTLYVSQQQQMLYELNADHTERWKVQLPGQAWGCQGLPNGHRLVSVYSHSMVIEYDDQGREVWRKDRLPGPPFGIQRLDNGNTLVACSHANKIVEIAPDKSTTEITVHGQPMSVQRLDSGNTLVALQAESRVVEVDRSGKIVWEAKTGNPPSHAQRLESGNTLVTLQYGRKVVEYDPTGKKVVWQSQVSLYNPYCAQRLASGSTLVADQQGLKEIAEDGKSIRWQLRQAVVTGVSAF
jgi:outer membrane protein assembly factor BamB